MRIMKLALSVSCGCSHPTVHGRRTHVVSLCRLTIVAIAIDALLGAGALARGWSSYLATLCNQPSDRCVSGSWYLRTVYSQLDDSAAAQLQIILSYSVFEPWNPTWCRFIVHSGTHDLDFVAFGLIIAVFLLVGWGTHQTSFLNSGEALALAVYQAV